MSKPKLSALNQTYQKSLLTQINSSTANDYFNNLDANLSIFAKYCVVNFVSFCLAVSPKLSWCDTIVSVILEWNALSAENYAFTTMS